MPEHDPKPKKTEIDANDMIRDYEESSSPAVEDADQTTMEWFAEAGQDAGAPDAVLSAGDLDAASEETASGEETVGGSTPTPDQDIVEEIGRAVGVSYEDSEPLDMSKKIDRRDEERWELNPASSEDFGVRSQNYDSGAAPGKAPSPDKRRPAGSHKNIKRKAA